MCKLYVGLYEEIPGDRIGPLNAMQARHGKASVFVVYGTWFTGQK